MKQSLLQLQKCEILTQNRKPLESEELWKNTDKVVYGPVASRRLGESVGINLIPGPKICSYNCIYCDVGLTKYRKYNFLPKEKLCEEFFNGIKNLKVHYEKKEIEVDYFTFCGNGENLDHPQFYEIYYFIKNILKEYFPNKPIAILTNGLNLANNKNIDLVNDMDINFIKLDAGDENTFLSISRPNQKGVWINLINNLKMVKDLRLETAIVHSPKISNLKSLQSSYIDIINSLEKNGNIRGLYLHNIDYPTPYNSIKYFSKEELLELGEKISKNTSVPVFLLHSQVNFRKDI